MGARNINLNSELVNIERHMLPG